MTTLKDLRTQLQKSNLTDMYDKFQEFEGTFAAFKMYFKTLEESLHSSDTKFKMQLEQAEKEFGDVEKEIKELLGEIEEWKGKFVLYQSLWKKE